LAILARENPGEGTPLERMARIMVKKPKEDLRDPLPDPLGIPNGGKR
jgi:hypothetical protein